MATGSNFAFKAAAKPLQTDRHVYYWQAIEIRHYHIQLYHRQRTTTYGLARIHALQRQDRRHIVSKARPNGWPKTPKKYVEPVPTYRAAICIAIDRTA